jgi:hypothetical protein
LTSCIYVMSLDVLLKWFMAPFMAPAFVQGRQTGNEAKEVAAAEDKEAALSALKAEHATALEQVKSEAELEVTTVCSMYEEQIAELQAERDAAVCPRCRRGDDDDEGPSEGIPPN